MRSFSEPAVEALLTQATKGAGFNRWLDFELVAAGHGQVELLLEVRPDMMQHHGFVHGGCVGALADTACAWAGAAAVRADVVTSSYDVHFLSPARGQRLRATAKTIRAGKRKVTVEAQVFCEADGTPPRLCAHSLASLAVVAASAAR